MSANLPGRLVIWLFLILVCMAIFVPPCSAGDITSAPTLVKGNLVYDFVGDRSRMIQISLVIVAFGCAIMWWYR